MVADEIEKLKRLLDQGAITQAEFDQAKAAALNGASSGAGSAGGASAADVPINRFRLSAGDRWIGGVCGGLGKLTGVESWIWRLGFVLCGMLWGSGVLAYLILWFFVPRES